MSNNERGVALGMVIVMALIFAVAAFGVMTLSVSRNQTSSRQAYRLRAQYAAEAGLVQATQRLWRDPTYPAASCIDGTCPACSPAGSSLTDTATVAGTSVAITVTNCGAGNVHALVAKVLYD